MIKKLTIIYIILALAIIIGSGAVLYFGEKKCQENQIVKLDNTEISENTNTNSINLTNMPTDRLGENQTYLSKYDYSVIYPKYYGENELYNIWVGERGGAVGLLEEWGVNKGQETIFVISVYPKDNKSEILEYYGHRVLDEKVSINGKTANKLKGMGVYDDLIVEDENYVFVIHSSFASSTDTPEYQEYNNILNNIKFE